MTPEERARQETWLRRGLELEELVEDPCPILAAGLLVKMKKFPIPNTEGMSPEEAEATLTEWRNAIREFERRTGGPRPLMSPKVPVS